MRGNNILAMLCKPIAYFGAATCDTGNHVAQAQHLQTCLYLQAFAIQSYVTGEGPYANWSKHVADPFGYNLLTIVGNEDRLPTL